MGFSKLWGMGGRGIFLVAKPGGGDSGLLRRERRQKKILCNVMLRRNNENESDYAFPFWAV